MLISTRISEHGAKMRVSCVVVVVMHGLRAAHAVIDMRMAAERRTRKAQGLSNYKQVFCAQAHGRFCTLLHDFRIEFEYMWLYKPSV